MADIFDKAILIGIGLEKKAKEVIDELQRAGKESTAEKGEGPDLTARQAAENKVVDEGVKALKEFLSVIQAGKERLEKEVSASSEKVLERLNVATQNDIDIIKEMARVAREKVDRLEKRVQELEGKLEKKGLIEKV